MLLNIGRTPQQLGQQTLYLKFNPQHQLIGVKVEETFHNETIPIFAASQLRPKSQLVLEQDVLVQEQRVLEQEFQTRTQKAKFSSF